MNVINYLQNFYIEISDIFCLLTIYFIILILLHKRNINYFKDNFS